MTEPINICGHEVELTEPEGLVNDVVVIARTIDPDEPGRDDLLISSTPHTGGITELGMIQLAIIDHQNMNLEADDD